MTIGVKVIEDTVYQMEGFRLSPLYGPRLTTLELSYPRFIHAEVMTHKDFSRNASSSRAIPVQRMMEMIHKDPAMPEKWVMNEPGMQGYTEAPPEIKEQAEEIWRNAMDEAFFYASQLHDLGLHKQHVNRLLEPWMHIRVVLTSTRWENFFTLRTHETAEPTFQRLANYMKEALKESDPRLVNKADVGSNYHLPYITAEERTLLRERKLSIDHCLAASVARCARVSYNNFDGSPPDMEKDLGLIHKILGVEPLHASPAEHQGIADPDNDFPERHANLDGWMSYRKTFLNEYIPTPNYSGGVTNL